MFEFETSSCVVCIVLSNSECTCLFFYLACNLSHSNADCDTIQCALQLKRIQQILTCVRTVYKPGLGDIIVQGKLFEDLVK